MRRTANTRRARRRQTAWALLGLMAAGEVGHPAVARGIEYLARDPARRMANGASCPTPRSGFRACSICATTATGCSSRCSRWPAIAICGAAIRAGSRLGSDAPGIVVGLRAKRRIARAAGFPVEVGGGIRPARPKPRRGCRRRRDGADQLRARRRARSSRSGRALSSFPRKSSAMSVRSPPTPACGAVGRCGRRSPPRRQAHRRNRRRERKLHAETGSFPVISKPGAWRGRARRHAACPSPCSGRFAIRRSVRCRAPRWPRSTCTVGSRCSRCCEP